MIAYRINLPGAVEGGSFEIESAKDDPILAFEEIEPEDEGDGLSIDSGWHRSRYGFDLTKFEIDVFLGHYCAWKKFSESSFSWCVILENNLTMPRSVDYRDVLESINSLNADWEVFFPFNKFLVQEKESVEALTILNPNIREVREVEPHILGLLWGSSIYFLSQRGVKKLLKISSIRQRVDDEILFLSKERELSTYFTKVCWLDVSDLPNFTIPERNQIIKDAIFKLDAWNSDSIANVRCILRRLSNIAIESDIELILQGGTHLGYIRHGGIIPWDDDIDIGIDELNLNLFLRKINEDPVLRVEKHMEKHTGAAYYKIWDPKGEKIEGYAYTFPFIDLWVYNRVENDIVFKNGIICPNSGCYPFITINFEGSIFKIPFNSIECLDTRYKDWKTQIRVYAFSHRLEKPHFPRLRAAISVDENGRMLD